MKYRAFRLGRTGNMLKPAIVVDAATDTAAVEQARRLAEGHDVAVWQASRKVAVLRSLGGVLRTVTAEEPSDHPSAEQYRGLAKRFELLAKAAEWDPEREFYTKQAFQYRKLAEARLPNAQTKPGRAFGSESSQLATDVER